MPIRTAALFPLALVFSVNGTLSAQATPVGIDPAAAADRLYSAGDALGAYDALVQQVHAGGDDYEILWRVARAGVAVGVQQEGNEAQNSYLDPAIIFAERALAARPDGVHARYWRGAAAGRRALNAGLRYSAELAQVVYDDGRALLAADSMDASAHNMMGKLYYEIMSLSRIERLLGRVFVRSDALTTASWDDAERHLVRATELDPQSVLYRFDWAVFLARRDRDVLAVSELEEVLGLPAVTPVDPMFQAEALRLLESMR